MYRRTVSAQAVALLVVAVLAATTPINQARAEAHKVAKQHGVSSKPAVTPVSTAHPAVVSPLVWSVVSDPIRPVKGTDGRVHVVYELNVRNDSRYILELTTIDTLDAVTDQPSGQNQAISADGQEVTGKVRSFALANPTQTSADFSQQLGPGQGGMVYFDLSYETARDIPQCLKHRVTVSFQKADGTPQTYTTEDECTPVSREKTLVIQAPLEGEGWLNANGSGPILSSHRYSTQATNGTLRSPEHFAIDFVKLNREGKPYSGNANDNASYFGYGLSVVSATRGRVVEVLDGMPDQVPGHLVPPHEISQFTGNYVIVAISSGQYALYAHLAPGSVRVKRGDTVAVGQILGKLGNSGNSDGPHLHFQIMDSASPFNTHGLPFVFKQMGYQGRLKGALAPSIESLFQGGAAETTTNESTLRTLQMPLTLDIVGFK